MKNYKDIVIMARCNLKCLYCYGGSHDLDIDATIQSIDRLLNKFNRNEDCFRMECRGEILLYPKLVHYLENKAEDGYRIEILTNGTNLDVLSNKSKLKTVISLDGHTTKMNIARGLTQEQINKILEFIFLNNSEIQCVYMSQTVDQINKFIEHLAKNKYRGFLHIFPCIVDGKHVNKPLTYEELLKVNFIAPKEYFDRWKYINTYKKRNFECDFLKNGYCYYIKSDEIFMLKCDGISNTQETMYPFDYEREMSINCGRCINHNEYNNLRGFIAEN